MNTDKITVGVSVGNPKIAVNMVATIGRHKAALKK
jgi:hypothetical protein